jgi:outer membrane protein assembly factor BamD
MAVLTSCASKKDVDTLSRFDVKELYQIGITKYQNSYYIEAEESFKKIIESYPLSAEAALAQLALADVYFASEKYEDASSYYTTFYSFHPAHPKAHYALFQKGMSHFKGVVGADRDQTETRKALFAFEDFISGYPDSIYTEKALELKVFLRRRLAESELYVGRYYFKRKNYKGALLRLADILEKYPEVGLTDKVLYYLGESYGHLGEDELAKDAYNTLLNEYPKSPFVRHAQKKLADG